MRTILIAGGTGLIGKRLSILLQDKGYTVIHLSRRARPDAAIKTFQWDVNNQTIDEEAILQADYVINLAGAGIADARWTDARKKLIIDSRTQSTQLLLDSFIRLQHYPKAYVASAAIGIYGDRGDELLTEDSPKGTGFLAESSSAWEEAINKVMATDIRTVGLRIGLVLSTKGGALEKIMQPFMFYLGAYFGNGQQWYSWIHIDDVCRMFIYAIEQEEMSGYYNAVGPNPVRNIEFTQKIGKALGKNALIIPAPAFGLRLGLGEMADAVLGSVKVSSTKIEESGFEFRFSDLITAIKDLVDQKI